jgi:pyrroline-5-carboxylate reductase
MVAFLVKEQTISIIGAGSLGTAVIDAMYSNGHRKITATRRSNEKLEEISTKYQGVNTTTSNVLAAQRADVLILAVKPYLIEEVSQEIAQYTNDKLVISLAAAKSIDVLGETFSKSRVARVMTGIFAKDEVAAYSLGKSCVAEDHGVIKYIFGSNVREVNEKYLAGRTWVACDTGIMAKEVEAKVNTLVASGMDSEDAAQFYAGTLRALASAIESGKSGEEIYHSVAGPESFTGKMYQEMLEKGHFRLLKSCVEKTIDACK